MTKIRVTQLLSFREGFLKMHFWIGSEIGIPFETCIILR